MKKIIAIVLTAVMAMSFLAINAYAGEIYIGRNDVIENGTIIQAGTTINFSGMKLAQVRYDGGSFVIYDTQYDGVSTNGFDYFEDTLLPSGFTVKDIGSMSTGHSTVDGSPYTEEAAIDYDIEHCVFLGWEVTNFQNTPEYINITFKAVWVEDSENPFPEPVVEEPSIIDIIINYVKEAATFLMGILAEVVVKVMEYLNIGTPTVPVV